jgi:hypothetical protein
MADAGKHFEAIKRGDEITGSLGGRAPDGVVRIAPDIERGHADRAEWRADRAARAIPRKGGFHRRLVAEHGKMLRDRGGGNAGGGEPLPQLPCTVSQQQIGGARLEKGLVMARAMRLLAIQHLQRAIEGVGVGPRQHGQRRQPLRNAIRERPGNAAAPVVADEMEAAVGIA